MEQVAAYITHAVHTHITIICTPPSCPHLRHAHISVMPTKVGIQQERKVRPITVMPAQAGIQRGDDGAEGIDLACIL